MKDTTYHITEKTLDRGRVLKWYVRRKDQSVVGCLYLMATKETVTSKDLFLQQRVTGLIADHRGSTALRRMILSKSYMILYDAFDQHTADHHYMETANLLVGMEQGQPIHPASMFEEIMRRHVGEYQENQP